ncbi:16808_t:CDS:1 [Acaulospora colombiana]|uniref:16808_t:CDS:1 n=1 Tax=Acaulospora colombiana TaxID=27376 RepID=A0ACA9QSU1_9GLOM|nr:16808_t:CDS:1 [Acaulospora colombiana]
MNGMTTGVNPMNLSFSPQQHQQSHQHQTPNATMMQLPTEHSPMGILQSMPPSANHQSPTHHPSPSHSQSGMGMMASSPTNAEAVMPSASTPTPLTPSAIMQQRAASMERASPAPGTPAASGNMSMDPNMVVNWQDLTAT